MTRTSVSDTVAIWIRANARRVGGLAGLPHGPHPQQAEHLPAVFWTIAIGAIGLLAYVLALAGASPVVRAPVVLGYLLFAPGWAIARQIAIPDSALRISIGLALSISIVGLLSIIQAFTGSWSPITVVLLTALITVTAGCVEIARERRKAGA